MLSFHSTLKENCPLGGISTPPLKSFVVFWMMLFAWLPLGPSFLDLKTDIHLGKVLPSQISGMDQRTLRKMNLSLLKLYCNHK